MDIKDIYRKIAGYCSYQDRCKQEVIAKLNDWEVPENMLPTILELLQDEKYLDEERYIRSYIRGKFEYKKWGRWKIKMTLKQKGISEAQIKEGLLLIDPERYDEVIVQLLKAKVKSTKAENDWVLKQKLLASLAAKGFEPEIVQELVDDVIKEFRS